MIVVVVPVMRGIVPEVTAFGGLAPPLQSIFAAPDARRPRPTLLTVPPVPPVLTGKSLSLASADTPPDGTPKPEVVLGTATRA